MKKHSSLLPCCAGVLYLSVAALLLHSSDFPLFVGAIWLISGALSFFNAGMTYAVNFLEETS